MKYSIVNKQLAYLSGVITMAILVGIITLLPAKTHAVSASDWQAGNIIDDTIFTNYNSMSVSQIQDFLNSVNPNCDTNGTQPATEYGRSDLTHAQYAALKGWPGPPYVCLKNYYEVPKTTASAGMPDNSYDHSGNAPTGSISAAQMIYNAAQQYHISPKVLLVKIRNESAGPLTSDTWPFESQYQYALGAHCPDSTGCDPNYAGFSIQISQAAYLMRYYLDNMSQSWWPYKKLGTNTVQYSPDASCGSSTVTITSMATAALYTYTPYQPNAAALAAGYGTAYCGAYGNRNVWLYYNNWFGSTHSEQTLLSYESQLSNLGWTNATTNSGVTGTVGEGIPMEALKISGDVEYSSYNYTTGWQPTVNRGMISGTEGEGKTIQAIKINPIGSLATNYDIYYRVEVSYLGWMGWAQNGAPVGVTGQSDKNIEAVEIYLAPKGLAAPGTTDNAYQNTNVVTYSPPLSLSISSQVQDYGWQPTVTDDMATGTTEQDKRMEAITIALHNNTGLTGDINYSAHLAGIGWQDITSDGAIAGTVGQSRQMEAIRMALTGQLSQNYDIWYRSYVQYSGWLGWAKDGDPAGSVGAGRQLEAIEIRLAPKNSLTLSTTNSLYNPTNQSLPDSYQLDYDTQVSYLGWINDISQNTIGGTTGQSKTIEAIKFNSLTSMLGSVNISCSSYVHNTGWMSDISEGSLCGTVNQSKPLDALKLSMSGDAASLYDIYYRVHLSYLGWQGWVKDGAQTGTPNSTNPIEAVQIKLVKK